MGVMGNGKHNDLGNPGTLIVHYCGLSFLPTSDTVQKSTASKR